MEVLEAIHRRRAIRDYKPDPVAQAQLRQVIEAACWAPSAMNEQPWHFVAVTDKAVLANISSRAKAWLVENNPTLANNPHLRPMLQAPEFNIFYGAPALIAIAAANGSKWTLEDCALAAENLMLAATELGLGTCWIGLAQDWLNTPGGRKILNLAPAEETVAPIVIGHPKSFPPAVARKPPTITWIGETEAMAEDGAAESAISHGVYGTLIHP